MLDVFSKYAWVKPIKNKTVDTVAKTFIKIFSDSGRKPKKLWTDRGGEFTGLIEKDEKEKGDEFKFECEYCKQRFKNQSGLTQHLNRLCPVLFPEKAKESKTKLGKDITLYHTKGKDKATIAERFVKTIKGKMWKYMTENETKRIIDVLPNLVKEYNNTFHSTIKMTPMEASKKENRDLVYKTAYENGGKTKKNIEKQILKNDISVGDKVRIVRKKKEGAKGYEANWSEEIFEVREIEKTAPPTYFIKDANGHHIKGPFYKQEVQKTEYDFAPDDGYSEPRTKENARIGKEAVEKERTRQREKKQRAATKKKLAGSGIESTLPDRTLSNFDLEKAAKDIPFWRGIFSRDKLPDAPNERECGILNLDSSDGKGTHWVAWHKNKNTKYYFDSYGIQPPTEIVNYLKSPIHYNSSLLQDPNTHICGHLCIYVLKQLSQNHDLLPIVFK